MVYSAKIKVAMVSLRCLGPSERWENAEGLIQVGMDQAVTCTCLVALDTRLRWLLYIAWHPEASKSSS